MLKQSLEYSWVLNFFLFFFPINFCGLLETLKWRYNSPDSIFKSVHNMCDSLCFLPETLSQGWTDHQYQPFQRAPCSLPPQFFQILLARGIFFFLCIPVVFMADIFRYIFHFFLHRATLWDPKGFQEKSKKNMRRKLPDSLSAVWVATARFSAHSSAFSKSSFFQKCFRDRIWIFKLVFHSWLWTNPVHQWVQV